MALSTFALFCSYCHHLSPEPFHVVLKLCPLNSNSPFLPPALTITILLPVSVKWTTLDTSYKWNYTVFVYGSLCLTYFT